MITESETIDICDLPEYIRERQPDNVKEEGALATLEQVERIHTLRVLESVAGNKVRAAELLGVSRAKLYRILGATDSPEATAAAPSHLPENPDCP
jgi:transcriptional regulator with PAS, ATPase and Fis domain